MPSDWVGLVSLAIHPVVTSFCCVFFTMGLRTQVPAPFLSYLCERELFAFHHVCLCEKNWPILIKQTNHLFFLTWQEDRALHHTDWCDNVVGNKRQKGTDSMLLLTFIQPLTSSQVPPMLAVLVSHYYHRQYCNHVLYYVSEGEAFCDSALQQTVSKYREGYWEGDIIFLLTILSPLSKHTSQALEHWCLVFEYHGHYRWHERYRM